MEGYFLIADKSVPTYTFANIMRGTKPHANYYDIKIGKIYAIKNYKKLQLWVFTKKQTLLSDWKPIQFLVEFDKQDILERGSYYYCIKQMKVIKQV